MASYEPGYFPVVLAAFDALMRQRAARGGGWQSTSGPAPLIVINGPVRQQLGFNGAGGAFGPGFPAERHGGPRHRPDRQERLRHPPHVLEQATQGLPGRWSICLAENEEESPWPPFAEDGGQPAGVSAVSATLLRTCEFVDNRHTPDPEQVLWDIADTISRTGSLIFRDTSAGVVFCPEHAQMLAAAGYAKQDVQAWLMKHCGRTGADLRRAGKNGLRGIARFADPDESAGRGVHPHPPVAAARPDRGGRRAQRGHLDGGPGLRRVVRHRRPGPA